jgi:hypothetical protein
MQPTPYAWKPDLVNLGPDSPERQRDRGWKSLAEIGRELLPDLQADFGACRKSVMARGEHRVLLHLRRGPRHDRLLQHPRRPPMARVPLGAAQGAIAFGLTAGPA